MSFTLKDVIWSEFKGFSKGFFLLFVHPFFLNKQSGCIETILPEILIIISLKLWIRAGYNGWIHTAGIIGYLVYSSV